MTPQELSGMIQHKRMQIDQLTQEINDIAKMHIPDFHFIDYQVSTFWICEQSPIGMCVFKLEMIHERLRPTSCRYCGGPVERK